VPGKAWTVKRAILALIILAIAAACGGTTLGNKLTLSLSLNTTTVRGGGTVNGFLVAKNPGLPIDLTQDETRLRCRTGFAVGLSGNGIPTTGPAFTANCVSVKHQYLKHGVTRWKAQITASYGRCTSGPASIGTPRCEPGGQIPPLPPGTYNTVVSWSTPVPLPKVPPVAIHVIADLAPSHG